MVKLLLNADDFGYTPAVSYGIIHAHQQGVLVSTTLMVNMGSSSILAAKLAHENPGLFVGLHVNLVTGKPISDPQSIASLVDNHGNLALKKLLEAGKEPVYEDVVREVYAQKEYFKELMGYETKHLEAHAVFHPFVQKAIAQVGLETKIHFVDRDFKFENGHLITTSGAHQLPYILPSPTKKAYYKENVSLAFWLEDQGNILNQEVTEMKTHPGFIDQTLMDSSSYVQERIHELAILCSDDLKQWLHTHHVQMISYEDLIG